MAMRFGSGVVAVLAALALAQPLMGEGGLAEAPPADFTGLQYIDSTGCVFLRATFGGTVGWVPQVNADRKPLCGYPPTLAQAPGAEAVAPADDKLPAADEVDLAAAVAAVAFTPEAAGQPEAPPQTASPRKIGCYKSAPVPIVVDLQGGGKAVVCTRGDGSRDGWRPPIYPEGSEVPPGQAALEAELAPGRCFGSLPCLGAAAPEAAPEPASTEVPVGTIFVQVGAFAVAANADRSEAQIAQMGLPAGRSGLVLAGTELQVIHAGPFTDRSEALAAQAQLRAAGFSDAFIR